MHRSCTLVVKTSPELLRIVTDDTMTAFCSSALNRSSALRGKCLEKSQITRLHGERGMGNMSVDTQAYLWHTSLHVFVSNVYM